MNLKLACLLFAAHHFRNAASLSHDDFGPDFTPDRLEYSVLDSDPSILSRSGSYEPLLDSLSSEGLVSITNVPDFAPLKRSMMQWLHTCIGDQGVEADHVLEMIQNDGTIRRSFASVTKPGPNGEQDFVLKSEDKETLSPACVEFSNRLEGFRAKVADVTALFSKRLHAEMGSSYNVPLMDTKDGSHSYDTIQNVVAAGDHLEHFHSYQKLQAASSSLRVDKQNETIELHTDQGFFIAFTPGLMVSHDDDKPDLDSPLWETEGFYIEKRDGSRVQVRFEAQDDLVFMMGDGVNQYINPKLEKDNLSQSRKLRATPHSVSLSSHDDNQSRVWYGRMVLPPKDAFSKNDGKSYGEIRSLLTHTNIAPGGLGCSTSNGSRALSSGGHAGEDECEDGELYCWARCQSLAVHNADDCAAQNLQLQCINPRDEFSDGKAHGDYYPACSNTTAPVTPLPALDNFPQNASICTDSEWQSFAHSLEYEHEFDVARNAKFLWSVKNGTVHGRLAFNGLFGWLALGLPNLAEGAGKNGMQGASVLMATPGDNYSPVTGFDFTLDSKVAEYEIHPTESSYRHWQTPITGSSSNVESTIIVDECFTSFKFEADGINSRSFNTDGTDSLLWAANGNDKFAGYHLRNRARFVVNWSTGEASIYKKEVIEPESISARTSTSLILSLGLVSMMYLI